MNFSSSDLIPVIREALIRGQRVRLTVNGSSMVPFIHDGDVVDLEPAKTVRRCDVALVQTREGARPHCVLHRVVKVTQNAFFLRGDSLMHNEGPFTNSTILGIVAVSSHRGSIRSIGSSWWRFGGLIWLTVYPLGTWLLYMYQFLRKVAGRTVRYLQRITFRALRRR